MRWAGRLLLNRQVKRQNEDKIKCSLVIFPYNCLSEAVGVWIWAVGLGSNCLIVYQAIARGTERERESERKKGGRRDGYRT